MTVPWVPPGSIPHLSYLRWWLTHCTVEPHVQLKWLPLFQNKKLQRQLGLYLTWVTCHEHPSPKPGQWPARKQQPPGSQECARFALQKFHYLRQFRTATSLPGIPHPLQGHWGKATQASQNPTCFPWQVLHAFDSFLPSTKLHNHNKSKRTFVFLRSALVLSAPVGTWILLSSLFLGMVLSPCDETDEKLEKQENHKGHMHES